ncbi:MAG: hypothetical protein ABSD57_00605 [Verrucomicrobiota bacterium]
MNKILLFDVVKSTSALENLSAFLTSKAMELAHAGRHRARAPPFNFDAAKFQETRRGARTFKLREFHARRVKISRLSRDKFVLPTVFIGIFSEKSVGIGGAKDIPESVLTVSVLTVEPAECHLNETKN